MVEALAEPINDKIQTESKVTSINYKNKSVKVRYEDRSGNEMIEKNLYAKKVIVTVPLGVLKKNQLDGGIAFRPLLPDKKRNVRLYFEVSFHQQRAFIKMTLLTFIFLL